MILIVLIVLFICITGALYWLTDGRTFNEVFWRKDEEDNNNCQDDSRNNLC